MRAVMFVLITTAKGLAQVFRAVSWLRAHRGILARRHAGGEVPRAGQYAVPPRTPSFSSVNWPTGRRP